MHLINPAELQNLILVRDEQHQPWVHNKYEMQNLLAAKDLLQGTHNLATASKTAPATLKEIEKCLYRTESGFFNLAGIVNGDPTST